MTDKSEGVTKVLNTANFVDGASCFGNACKEVLIQGTAWWPPNGTTMKSASVRNTSTTKTVNVRVHWANMFGEFGAEDFVIPPNESATTSFTEQQMCMGYTKVTANFR